MSNDSKRNRWSKNAAPQKQSAVKLSTCGIECERTHIFDCERTSNRRGRIRTQLSENFHDATATTICEWFFFLVRGFHVMTFKRYTLSMRWNEYQDIFCLLMRKLMILFSSQLERNCRENAISDKFKVIKWKRLEQTYVVFSTQKIRCQKNHLLPTKTCTCNSIQLNECDKKI